MFLQALGAVLSNGTDSLFSQQLANSNVSATATAANLQPLVGDSFSEQVLGYIAAATHLDKVPIGLPVGLAIGGALVLAATATLTVYIYRQRKQNKLQQVSKICGHRMQHATTESLAMRPLITFTQACKCMQPACVKPLTSGPSVSTSCM